MKLSLKKKKSSKNRFFCCFFFPKGSFFTLPSCSLPWVMLTHLLVLGCPALETSTNPPTPPGEAMPSIEEATLILFLGFSCWVGAKGCSINKVRQLAKSVPNSLGAAGREHSPLVLPLWVDGVANSLETRSKKTQDKSVKSAVFAFISITVLPLRGSYFGICRNWLLGGAGGPEAEMLPGAGGSRSTDVLGLDTTSAISPLFFFPAVHTNALLTALSLQLGVFCQPENWGSAA